MGAGLGEGVGSLFEGYLKGRQARLAQQAEDRAQQQQDLEQSKYETYKQQLGKTNAQKEQELEQNLEAGISQYGSGGYEYVQALKNRPSAPQNQVQQMGRAQVSENEPGAPGVPTSDDWAQYMGGGALNKSPGGGMIAQQGSPLSTVPSSNAQVNQGLPKHVPSMFERQQVAQRYKDIQDKINNVAEKGGKAHMDASNAENPQFVLDNLGPQANAEITNLKHGQRSAEGAIQNQYQTDPIIDTAHKSNNYMTQIIDSYNDRSPLGMASMQYMVYKMKDPGHVPDASSVQDALKNEATPDYVKNNISKILTGTYDKETADNILRDANNTFIPQYNALKMQQQKYKDKAIHAGQDASYIVSEPALDDTFKKVSGLRKQLGEYKPPAERPGFINSVYGGIAKAVGLGSPNESSAAPQTKEINGVTYTKVNGGWKRAR